MRSVARLVIPVIYPRAIILWALIRLVFVVIPLAGGGALASMPVPPMGVVVLACIVGLLDIRMRGERVLWANLGVTPLGISAVYFVAAISAEIILTLVVR